MRDIEKYYYNYTLLGIPDKPLLFLLSLSLKKGVHPTVYSHRYPFLAKLLAPAKICVSDGMGRDGILLDILSRHADFHQSKRLILIFTPQYRGFIERNSDILKKSFVIRSQEEIQ